MDLSKFKLVKPRASKKQCEECVFKNVDNCPWKKCGELMYVLKDKCED